MRQSTGPEAGHGMAPWFPSRWGLAAWWVLLLVFVGLAGLVASGAAEAADVAVLGWTADTRSESLTSVALAISWAGTFPWIVAFAAAAAALLDRRLATPWRTLGRVAAALTLDVVIVAGLKQVVDRPRPPTDGRLTDVLTASFPSGHATATAVVGGVLVLTVLAAGTSRRLRLATVTLALLTEVAMCWSRVYLGVHYVTDVIAGAALGVWLALSTAWVFDAVGARQGLRAEGGDDPAISPREPDGAASPRP